MAIIERAVGDRHLARQCAVQTLKIGGHALVERDPVQRQVLGSDRLDDAGNRMGDHAADVGLGMLGKHAAPRRSPRSVANSAALSRPIEEML